MRNLNINLAISNGINSSIGNIFVSENREVLGDKYDELHTTGRLTVIDVRSIVKYIIKVKWLFVFLILIFTEEQGDSGRCLFWLEKCATGKNFKSECSLVHDYESLATYQHDQGNGDIKCYLMRVDIKLN